MNEMVWGKECWWGDDWCAMGGSPRYGNKALIRKLLLDKSTYVSGGWELVVHTHPGMRCVLGAFQISDAMPNCHPIDPNGHQVVLKITPQSTKLQLWVNGAEAPAGYQAPADTWLGVGLVGA